jgi:peptidoglycan/LPS O-acetylase OafA/YrhL
MASASATDEPTGRRPSPHLDALRILAAAAIVVLHYANYVTAVDAEPFLLHFNLFVDLFFVISGFVIAGQYIGRVETSGSIGRFLWRRLARIYPLHAVTLAFYVAIALLLYAGLVHVENLQRYALSDIPAQVFLLHAIDGERLTFNFPSWSLSAEMVCYLLFPLLAYVGLRRPRLILALAGGVAAALTLYAIVAHTTPWPTWINQGGAWRALPGFFLGVGLYLHRARVARLPLRAVLLPALLVFVLAGWALPDLAALALIYLIGCAAVCCDEIDAPTALARSGIGRWAHLTYSSYMLHMPVATLMVTLLGRFVGASPLVLIAAAVPVLACASAASYRWFEDPIRQWLNAALERGTHADRTVAAMAPQRSLR